MADLRISQILSEARASGVISTLALSEHMGVPRTTLRRKIAQSGIEEDLRKIYRENVNAKGDARIASKDTGTSKEIVSEGDGIRTLDELLEAAQVNTAEWSVKDYNVSTWEQGGTRKHAVRAKLERVEGVPEIEAMKAAAIDAMREHAPLGRDYMVRPAEYKHAPGLAMEVSIPDLHLGKLAHAEETGANYDGKIGSKAFRYVMHQFIERAYMLGVERFIFPVGNDLLHVDGDENETTRGTRQDVDTRWYRSLKRAQELLVEALDAMVAIAPVDVVIVPGNHARIQEAMLGQIVSAWYRNEPRATVHDSPAPRQYIRHGSTLLGFTHGDGAKPADLPLLMATEVPGEWAATEHRAFSIGHTHSRKSNRFGSVAEYKGVEVRTSPSLSASDAWHVSKGYVGNLRAAEAFVHDEVEGEVARFRAVLPKDFE